MSDAEDPKEREEVALGVIPNELMNAFAHFWGFSDSDIEKTVASLKKRRIRKIDLGCIRYVNKKGEKCRSIISSTVSISDSSPPS